LLDQIDPELGLGLKPNVRGDLCPSAALILIRNQVG